MSASTEVASETLISCLAQLSLLFPASRHGFRAAGDTALGPVSNSILSAEYSYHPAIRNGTTSLH